MTIENLEKQLKTGNLDRLYLFYGDEQFLLDSCVKKIKTLFGECVKGINYILIDDTNVGEIISDIETPSFGYEKKLILAKNTGIFKKEGKRKTGENSKLKEKLLGFLQDNLDIVRQSVFLVFVEQEVEKQELVTFFEKNGIVCKFDFQNPMQIQARLQSICNSYKVKVDAPTLQYLIECCGTSMQDLINEIRKLIEYAGEGGIIQKKDIDQLCIKKLESVIFDLTDNLGKRNVSKALEVLQNLLYAKEPLQRILVTLYNHFKKLYLTKLALKYKKDMVTSLNLKPNQTFLVNKYKMQASYFKEEDLRGILQSLADLDYEYKTGIIDLLVGLQTVLCKYCGSNA